LKSRRNNLDGILLWARVKEAKLIIHVPGEIYLLIFISLRKKYMAVNISDDYEIAAVKGYARLQSYINKLLKME
jgi:hypothetical protein